MKRTISKKIELITSSIKGYDTLSKQTIVNFYIYFINNALELSYSQTIHLKMSHIRQILGKSATKLTNNQIKELLLDLSEVNARVNIINISTKVHEEKSIPLFAEVAFDNTNKNVRLVINQKFVENYLKYNENNRHYVKVFLNVAQNAKSKFTPKIIEILSSRVSFSLPKETRNIKLEIEELKKLLGIEGQYKEFKNFKRKVLDVVAADAAKLGFNFKYNFIKTGRAVIKIEFIMETKDKKAWARRFSEAEKWMKYKAKKEDEMLIYVRQKAKEDTVAYLKDKLMCQKEFADNVKDIVAGDKYSMYKFVFKDVKTTNDEDLFLLANFADLEDVLNYFTKKGFDNLKIKRVVKSILHQDPFVD